MRNEGGGGRAGNIPVLLKEKNYLYDFGPDESIERRLELCSLTQQP